MLAFDLALAWIPYPRLAAWAKRRSRRSTPDLQGRQAEEKILHLVRLVDGVARNHWKPMGCLRRSLCLQALLARRGIATSLRVGVDAGASLKEGKGLEAHAWLEWQGQPINDREDVAERYLPLSPARSFEAREAGQAGEVEAPGAP